jgi:tetraacyldisaccharide 4'-kinase
MPRTPAERPDATLRARIERRLGRLWFGPRTLPDLLLSGALAPLSALVSALARSRRRRIAAAKLRPREAAGANAVPVVVVGNLVVGGTGKTPLLIALVDALGKRGWRPGVISRGYRAHAPGPPRLVGTDTAADAAGDEPVLVARRTGRPVAVGAERAAALALLLERTDCDVAFSDDGLQHVRLRRDVEIAVFDGRGAGNGACLPAGPLREPLAGLRQVDALALNGPDTVAPLPHPRTFRFEIRPTAVVGLDGVRRWTPAAFAAESAGHRCTAIAGIGMPQRFFDSLAALGIAADAVALPDHARIDPHWLASLPARWLIMTEKDAVKCLHFDGVLLSRCVALVVDAVPENALLDWLEDRLRGQPPA